MTASTAAVVDRLDHTIREAAAAEQQLNAYGTRPLFSGTARSHYDALHHAWNVNCAIIADQLDLPKQTVQESFGCEFGPDYTIQQVRNSLITEADPNPIGRVTKAVTIWLDHIDQSRQQPGWNPFRRLRVEGSRQHVEWAIWRLAHEVDMFPCVVEALLIQGRNAGLSAGEIAQSIIDHV